MSNIEITAALNLLARDARVLQMAAAGMDERNENEVNALKRAADQLADNIEEFQTAMSETTA